MNYRNLQDKVDGLIKIVGGSENAAMLLDGLLAKEGFNEKVSSFIDLAVALHFKISPSEIRIEGRENSDVRKICYKLHKEILNLSIRQTAALYNRTENPVMRALHRMEEIINDPRSDMMVYSSYKAIDENVQKFVKFLKQ